MDIYRRWSSLQPSFETWIAAYAMSKNLLAMNKHYRHNLLNEKWQYCISTEIFIDKHWPLMTGQLGVRVLFEKETLHWIWIVLETRGHFMLLETLHFCCHRTSSNLFDDDLNFKSRAKGKHALEAKKHDHCIVRCPRLSKQISNEHEKKTKYFNSTLNVTWEAQSRTQICQVPKIWKYDNMLRTNAPRHCSGLLIFNINWMIFHPTFLNSA